MYLAIGPRALPEPSAEKNRELRDRAIGDHDMKVK
jgi:hypothetical protein